MEKFSNPTDEEIEAWKKQYGQITEIAVEERKYHFKNPSRAVVKLANARLAATKSVEDYVDVLINNCILNGKEHLESSDEDYFSILPLVQELIPSKEAVLKKL